MRVNAQLIDAGTGAHLWADRFDEAVSNLFKLQDVVPASPTRSVWSSLRAEALRAMRERPNNPECGRSFHARLGGGVPSHFQTKPRRRRRSLRTPRVSLISTPSSFLQWSAWRRPWP